jgi:RHH-type proline utilization regulon transcriptional repressor/proline dehydrogenase/delta 1-pyrroline-5-carboxylate dehydrogenase
LFAAENYNLKPKIGKIMLTTTKPLRSSLRDTITKAYRMDENECLNYLISQLQFAPDQTSKIEKIARQLVIETRESKKKQGKIDAILNQYDLSTDEGIALMCLSESLLRVPDKATMDKLISDKLSTGDWKEHLKNDQPAFVNAATWSLLLTGKIYGGTLDSQKTFGSALKRAGSRLGAAMIRPFILQMMKAIGNQFIIGEDIQTALKRGNKLNEMHYRLSYDMLGEVARTKEDAEKYKNAYVKAIDAIGKAATNNNSNGTPITNPGISVKLSALTPRFEYTQQDRVMKEVPPILLALAKQAKEHNIGLTVDAEEADRLDLTLDIFECVFKDPALTGWEGFGLAVQAYQKRAYYVLDWLAALSKRENKRIMVRLVKGAYWDAEIKLSQIQGQSDYPVFTRKHSTDVSFLACAKKMLNSPQYFYSQFGTHNAYCVAAILEMSDALKNNDFEFQGLQGMCRPLYDQIVDPNKFNRPCRIYAPVGPHIDLLGYLVRRLLENGANSSFINRLADKKTPIDEIIQDPVARIASIADKPHPKIPKPRDIYGKWSNAKGIDLSNNDELMTLKDELTQICEGPFVSASIVDGDTLTNDQSAIPVRSPNLKTEVIGTQNEANENDIEKALTVAKAAEKSWANTPYDTRAQILERAATLFEDMMPTLIALLSREGGRCILDCISEVREATDYCRYYAYRARCDLIETILPGPTGETNVLTLHPRGTIATISPWNFPLAIFTGQIVAALVTGNTVIAKPAEQTPLIAYLAANILYEAGVPKDALQLLIGKGETVGAKLVSDARVNGVIFTGSTETAKSIAKSLANREGPIGFLIAETGGQNAMIVDSSALPEQVVVDITQSAFNSAGQRCSALRVLFVQEEIAPKLLTMLKGHMDEMVIGDPGLLSTDVGPVIDDDAFHMLNTHFAKMSQIGKLIAKVPMQNVPSGNYFAPCAFEINDLSILTGEVFGPILHVIRYNANQLNEVIEAIINTGYGLTFGMHSRIDTEIQRTIAKVPVGNLYINRNMIGAVVGVQPFGGERLSGTGPKAGGPHYLPRLCVERCITTNTTALGGNARLVSLLEND